MRRLRKIVLALLAVTGVLLGGIAAAAALFIARPQWFLTTETVSRAIHVLAASYHPRWKSFDFGVRSLSFSEKVISLYARDLCFEHAASGLEGCVKELDVQVGVRLYVFGVNLTKISRLIVSGDHLNLDQTRSQPDASQHRSGGLPTSLPTLLPAALRGLAIETLRVDLPAIEIIQTSGTIRADLRLRFDPAQARPMALTLELDQRSGKARTRYHGEASLDSDLFRGKPLSYLDAQGRLNADGVNVQFQAGIRQKESDEMTFTLNASARLPGRRVEAVVEGSRGGTRFGMTGSAGVWEDSGPIRSVQLKPFTLEALLKKDSTEWERITFDGRFELEPEVFVGKSLRRSPARTLEGRVAIHARSTPGTLEKDHVDADVSVVVKPIKDWCEFHGSFEARVSGRASRVETLSITHTLDVGLNVPRFEHLVEFLSRTPYAVPAPLCVLKGPLSVSVKGRGGPHDEHELTYEVVSGLAAGRQALKFDMKGTLIASRLLSPGRSFKDETKVTVKDIALQLPRLDIKGLSPFLSDSRIKNGPDSEKQDQPGSATAMAVALRVNTVKPILFYSNLARDPVPVVVNLVLNSPTGGVNGTVDIRPFRAVIFRRTASIDHITLSGRAGSTLMDLDGLIVYRAGETRISIRLLGSAQKPVVEFESDPPMSQADIMAMLLFGKSPNELDSDQQSSVANTQTAVANSAFGLASLYLLASTPVDYVGYDPASRTYTVKLRLPGGATLQVGSDGRSKGVQLRKRIASHLALQTELTSTRSQGNVVTTFLEWFGRR